MRDQTGIALMTVLIVMVIGMVLAGIVHGLLPKGYQTYSSKRQYDVATQEAQGGLEQAVLRIQKSLIPLDSLNATSQTNADYSIQPLYTKSRPGYGGSLDFAPSSSQSSGQYSKSVFYLLSATAIEHESQAELYQMYERGY